MGVAAATLMTTIVENGAPISVDECTAALQKDSLAERVDFTNVSQRTATDVRFGFEIVDTIGRTEQIVSGDVVGTFAPAQSVHRDVQQRIDSLPTGAKILCIVQMVRFGDGSVWHEGDGPPGSAPVLLRCPAQLRQRNGNGRTMSQLLRDPLMRGHAWVHPGRSIGVLHAKRHAFGHCTGGRHGRCFDAVRVHDARVGAKDPLSRTTAKSLPPATRPNSTDVIGSFDTFEKSIIAIGGRLGCVIIS